MQDCVSLGEREREREQKERERERERVLFSACKEPSYGSSFSKMDMSNILLNREQSMAGERERERGGGGGPGGV